jgi:phosphohistidine phosphatase
MDLFVIRHAPAVPRSERIEDARRPLTDKGRRRWSRAVRGLDRLGVRFDRVYHSPWFRAVETAEALVDLVTIETVVTKELAKRPTAGLLRALSGKRIAVVGHQPWLGELVGMLALGRLEDGVQFELRKGAIVRLEGDSRPRGMVVRAVLPPNVLRALAAPPTQ